jgi:hypothetical protein
MKDANAPPDIQVIGGIPGVLNVLVCDDRFQGRSLIIQGATDATVLHLISACGSDGQPLHGESTHLGRAHLYFKLPHDGEIGPWTVSVGADGKRYDLPEIFCSAKVWEPQKKERIIFN